MICTLLTGLSSKEGTYHLPRRVFWFSKYVQGSPRIIERALLRQFLNPIQQLAELLEGFCDGLRSGEVDTAVGESLQRIDRIA